jgi:two-component system alkaline phosphatase synthesis response regulator PhoP
MRTILIVEDDTTFRDGLAITLEREGYRVLSLDNGDTVPEVVLAERPSLVLLDVMLPGNSGFEVCRQLRWQGSDVPVIMMTAQKMEEIDRVAGLELGADDYLLKPFGMRELLARIGAHLRRYPDPATGSAKYAFDNVEIDFTQRTVSRAGRPVKLTVKEFDLLRILIRRRGHAVSRDDLLDRVWGSEEYPTTRTVDMHILALRRKLEADPADPKHILTVHGEGYRFV